jgi:glyoxylase I family protein
MAEHRDFAAWRDQLLRTHLRAEEQLPKSSGQGLHHLALICSDVEATIRFYQDILAFPLVDVFENRDYPGSTHFFFDIGHGNMLAFFDFPGLGLGRAVEAVGGVQHVAISVKPDTFAELRDRLDKEGIAYLGPDRGLEGSLYVKDPDGIQIELVAAPLRQL